MPGHPRADAGRVMAALGDLAARFSPGLAAYVEDLLEWNPQLGLFSKPEPEATLAKLLRQSVVLWDFACEARGEVPGRVVDVGTGGGFPGLVWKLLSPALDVVLIERKARKAEFLDRVAHRLGRPDGLAVAAEDITVFARREPNRGSFDLAALMALGPSEAILRALDGVLAPGGVVVTVRPAGETPAGAGFEPIFRSAQSRSIDGAKLLLLVRP